MVRCGICMVILLFFTSLLTAQEHNNSGNRQPVGPLKKIQRDGSTADPDVSPRKCKIYYEYHDTLIIAIQTEGGVWVSYYLSTGISDINLDDCGLGGKRLCEKNLKICTQGKAPCETLALDAKSRYEITWHSRKEKWIIRKR